MVDGDVFGIIDSAEGAFYKKNKALVAKLDSGDATPEELHELRGAHSVACEKLLSDLSKHKLDIIENRRLNGFLCLPYTFRGTSLLVASNVLLGLKLNTKIYDRVELSFKTTLEETDALEFYQYLMLLANPDNNCPDFIRKIALDQLVEFRDDKDKLAKFKETHGLDYQTLLSEAVDLGSGEQSRKTKNSRVPVLIERFRRYLPTVDKDADYDFIQNEAAACQYLQKIMEAEGALDSIFEGCDSKKSTTMEDLHEKKYKDSSKNILSLSIREKTFEMLYPENYQRDSKWEEYLTGNEMETLQNTLIEELFDRLESYTGSCRIPRNLISDSQKLDFLQAEIAKMPAGTAGFDELKTVTREFVQMRDDYNEGEFTFDEIKATTPGGADGRAALLSLILLNLADMYLHEDERILDYAGHMSKVAGVSVRQFNMWTTKVLNILNHDVELDVNVAVAADFLAFNEETMLSQKFMNRFKFKMPELNASELLSIPAHIEEDKTTIKQVDNIQAAEQVDNIQAAEQVGINTSTSSSKKTKKKRGFNWAWFKSGCMTIPEEKRMDMASTTASESLDSGSGRKIELSKNDSGGSDSLLTTFSARTEKDNAHARALLGMDTKADDLHKPGVTDGTFLPIRPDNRKPWRKV